MNTFHQQPRRDCKNFAPCGIHSLSKCRKYKGTLKECLECTLVRRKSKTLTGEISGKKMCPHCGQFLNISMFGLRNVCTGGKIPSYRLSWCKMCMTKESRARYRKKLLTKNPGFANPDLTCRDL